MKVDAIGGSYEGKISADGNTISGAWTQAQPLPLILSRATPQTEWTIPDPLPPPKIMAPDAKPAFEVSTIKPAKPGRGHTITVNRSGIFNTTSFSLSDLIMWAYDVHPRQIAKGPSWLETDKFDLKPHFCGECWMESFRGAKAFEDCPAR